MKNFLGKNQKIIMPLIVSFALAIVVVYTGFVNVILEFIIIGAVPSTSYKIPATIMLVACGAIAWLMISYMAIDSVIKFIRNQKQKLQQYTYIRNRLPKRRYGRISQI